MGKLGKRKRARDAVNLFLSDEIGSSVSVIVDYKGAERAADSLVRRLDYYSSSKAVRALLFPLLSFEISRGTHFEPRVDWSGAPEPDVSPEALAPLLAAAATLSSDLSGQFSSPAARGLRRALHPLVVILRRGGSDARYAGDAGDTSLVARTSQALRAKDWRVALGCLYDIALSSGPPPRLGTLQRWVRDADLARDGSAGGGAGGENDDNGAEDDGDDGRHAEAAAARATTITDGDLPQRALAATSVAADKNLALLVLDGIMRAAAAGASIEGAAEISAARKLLVSTLPVTTFSRHEPFRLPNIATSASTDGSLLPATRVRGGARIAALISGASRRPPSPHDLKVWTTLPRTVELDAAAREVLKFDVPHVSGAFLCAPVLSPAECSRMISAAESLSFSADAVDGIEALQWLVDEPLLSSLFSRVQVLLPAMLGGDRLAGLNARWRFFRYSPGAEYRAHIDGAWPGAGLDPHSGKLLDDAFDGRRVSRLTFLVYLNEGFDGGTTTFFRPNARGPGHIDAFSVKPSAGAVLVFPHGDSASLVHEGSAVDPGGVKYVIRTDVLYERPGGGAPSGGGAQK